MIIGLKELEVELEKIADVDMKQAVNRAIGLVQETAKALCPVHYGELRQSIYTSTQQVDDAIIGTCYTNKEYAAYVEFGTGPNGQASHAGISPDVDIAYSQTGWMIPANAMSLNDAESYGFGIAKGKNGEPIGYYTNGQAAHPFMYPALKNNENEATEIIANVVRSQL